MVLPIYIYGQPVLRKVAEDIPADYPDLEAFLKEMGLPVRLSEMGIKPDLFPVLADRALQTAGSERVGGVSKLTREEVIDIYRLAE